MQNLFQKIKLMFKKQKVVEEVVKINNPNIISFDNDPELIYQDEKHNSFCDIDFDLETTMKHISYVPYSKNCSLNINCVSNLDHPLKYQWYRLKNEFSSEYELIENHNLNYLNLSEHEVKKSHNVVYKCRIIDTLTYRYCEVSSIIKVVYPELVIHKKPFLLTTLKLNDSTQLNLEAEISNNEQNPDWQLVYEWKIFKNNRWINLEDDNNFSGTKTPNLKIEHVNSNLLGCILCCHLDILNAEISDSFNYENQFQVKLTSQIPDILDVKIVSDQISDEYRYSINDEPILKADITLNGYNQLPYGYTFLYKWYEFKNNTWVLSEYKSEYKLEKQINTFSDTKIKCNVCIIDLHHKIVSNFTSSIINLKPNPSVYVNNAWRNINIWKDHEISISTNPIVKVSNNKIQYQWYWNNEKIDPLDEKYWGQNSPKLTIKNALCFNSGEYQLCVNVNGLDYKEDIEKTKIIVFNNPPKITNVSFPDNIQIKDNKKFSISLLTYPEVDYQIALTQFKFQWFIKDKFDDFISLDGTEGVSGAKSPTITFNKFMFNKNEISLKLLIQYVDIKDVNNVYASYWTKEIKIYQ